ncbi:MAG: leucine-rich repeat protein [Lachnospiraceae bacterium]|nr:leucine-rich repeat protein [Lachnospiraceae bacterium]
MKLKGIRRAAGLLIAAFALAMLPAEAKAEEAGKYVMVNIPYDVFYEGELTGNSTKVDTVSSATSSKWKNTGLVGGSYHTGDIAVINGVSIPVKLADSIKEEDLAGMKVDSKEALFAAGDYAWMPLEETPNYYKIAESADFKTLSKADLTAVTSTSDATVKISYESRYGDYQLSLSAAPTSNDVYAAILHTNDGDYGLRHLENIWRKGVELSFGAGFKEKEGHGNTLSADHYRSIMGKKLTGITFYTTEGVVNVNADVTFLEKTGAKVEVAEGTVADGTTGIAVTETGFGSGFDARYAVEGLADVAVQDGKMTFAAENVKAGSYTLTVSDAAGKYAPVSASFTITTAAVAAKYDEVAGKLTAMYNNDEFANYLKNITAVTVNGKTFNATGKRAVALINVEDGSIDLSKADSAKMDGVNEITVNATGYTEDLSFVMDLRAEQKITGTKTYSKTVGDAAFKLDAVSDQGAELSYESSNAKVAKVSEDGTVTPVAEGKATITVRAAESETMHAAELSVEITVKKAEVKPAETKPAESKPAETQPAAPAVKANAVYTVGKMKYKVTNADMSGKGTVALTGTTTAKKKLKTLKVPNAVTIEGASFQVTEIGNKAFQKFTKLKKVTIGAGVTKIGKNAFSGDKKLKNIVIKSAKLKSVGKNAIKGIQAKATIKVPKKQLKAYKKLFKGKTGFKKSMKIKK